MNKEIQFDRALLALAEIYISIYEFNMVENTLQPIKSNQYIDALAEPFEGAQEKLNNVMKNITVAEHVDMIMSFSDLSTLEDRIGNKTDVSIVFMGKINGWCRARFIVLERDKDGRLLQVLYTVECIHEEKLRENHLLYLSQTDLLTHIYNRGHGEKAISELIEDKQLGMFILFDVDKFKLVNDKYGHQIGDQVLIEVADALTKVISEGDIVMRLGGDEFAAYFPNIKTKLEGEKLIQKIFAQIASIHISPMEEPVSISLGARFAKETDNFDSVYKSADDGVYASKNSKGSSFWFTATE